MLSAPCCRCFRHCRVYFSDAGFAAADAAFRDAISPLPLSDAAMPRRRHASRALLPPLIQMLLLPYDYFLLPPRVSLACLPRYYDEIAASSLRHAALMSYGYAVAG